MESSSSSSREVEQGVNAQRSAELGRDPRYAEYLEFLRSQGALVSPDLRFPVAFSALGYTGVQATRDVRKG